MNLQIETLDVHDDAAVREWHAAYYAVQAHDNEFHAAYAFEELLAGLRSHSRAQSITALSARRGRDIVGVATMTCSLDDNLQQAGIQVYVIPSARRRGIGSQVLRHVESFATADGRSILQTSLQYPVQFATDGGAHPGAQFARNRGYRFALASQQRILDLPVLADHLTHLAAQAAAHHQGYRLHTYIATPSDLLLELGALRLAVDSEAPTGDLAREPATARVEDVHAEDADLEQAGRSRFGAYAVAPDGELAGYTEVVVAKHDPEWVYQWGTLVVREHRGHRLGLALKVANLQHLQAHIDPGPRMRTWNADANAPMIAVNEQLGFRSVARLGEFEKRI